MPDAKARVSSQSVESVLVVRVSGALAGDGADTAAEELADVAAALPPPTQLVLDLRAVTELSAAGARMMGEFVTRQTERGVHCAATLERDGEVAHVLRGAVPAEALPVHGNLDAAVSDVHRLAAGTDDELGGQLAALTRVLLDATTVEQALRRVLTATTVVIPHVELASVTLRDPGGQFYTPVETDRIATELDQVQYDAGAGPCMDAAAPEGPGYCLEQDLSHPKAWHEFAAAANGRGYGSVLSTAFQPSSGEKPIRGALNVYSRTQGFSDDDRHRAFLLATHASLALARTHAAEIAALQTSQLRQAIDSRDVIGQAKGILMARQGLTADEAFDRLKRTSQDLNVKLVEIASTLVSRHSELAPPP